MCSVQENIQAKRCFSPAHANSCMIFSIENYFHGRISFNNLFALSQQSGLHFYQCHRCGKGFIHKSSFEMHLLAHDDIRKKKCPHCSQMFRSTSHLNRHLRIHVNKHQSFISIQFNSFRPIFFLDRIKTIFVSDLRPKICTAIQYECSSTFA